MRIGLVSPIVPWSGLPRVCKMQTLCFTENVHIDTLFDGVQFTKSYREYIGHPQYSADLALWRGG